MSADPPNADVAAELLEAAPVGVFRTDPRGDCTFVNRRWCEIAGLAPEEALGDGWTTGLHPEDRSAVVAEWRRAAEEGRPFRLEYRFLRKDGVETWVLGQSVAVRGPSGALTGHIGTVTDITETRRAQETAGIHLARMNEAQRLAKIGSWELDLVRNRLTWSDEIFRMFEVDPGRFGASYDAFLSAIHPDDRDAVHAAYRRSVTTRTPYSMVHRLRMSDGRIKWVQERCETFHDADGKPIRSLGTVQDITSQVLAEERLTRTEQEIRRARDLLLSVIDSSPDWVFAKDLEHRFLLVNKAFASAQGLHPSEMVGRPDTDFWPTELCEGDPSRGIRGFHHDDREAFAGTQLHNPHDPATLGDGQLRIFDTIKGPLRDGQGNIYGVLAYARDVTEQRAAEDAAHRASELQRAVVAGAPIVLYALDRDGVFTLSEGRALDKLGLAPGQVVGTSALELYAGVPGFRDAFSRALSGEQVVLTSKIGPIEFEALYAPRYDTRGRIDGVVGVAFDVTERKQNEARIASQLAEKEVLLREIHHRVKNNLQIISSLLHFQAKKVTRPEDRAAFADGRNRLLAMYLVHEKLYQSKELSNVEFAEYVRSLVGSLSESFEGRSRVVVEVEAEPLRLPIETALPAGMILSELLTNVFKYAFPEGRGGRVKVRLLAEGGRAVLGVSDDGVGFPQGFDPDKLPSFGWQLIRSLVMQVDGVIAASTDHGARVEVSFPLSAELPRVREGVAAPTRAP